MATRRQSVFSGTMKFGLLTVPVKFYKPHFDTEEAPSSHFEHNCGRTVVVDDEPLHIEGNSGQPIQRPWYCPACQKNVEYAELLKVYDNGAVLTKEVAKSARIDDKEFIIKEFVPAADVDSMHLAGDVYFIEIGDKAGVDGYSAFAQAMLKSGKVGIASWTSRGVDKVVVVRPYKKGLVAQVLNYGNLQDAPDYGTIDMSESDEVAMLSMIMDKKTVAFEPSKYKSEYVANLRKLTGENVDEVAVVAPAPKKSSLAEMLAAMAA